MTFPVTLHASTYFWPFLAETKNARGTFRIPEQGLRPAGGYGCRVTQQHVPRSIADGLWQRLSSRQSLSPRLIQYLKGRKRWKMLKYKILMVHNRIEKSAADLMKNDVDGERGVLTSKGHKVTAGRRGLGRRCRSACVYRGSTAKSRPQTKRSEMLYGCENPRTPRTPPVVPTPSNLNTGVVSLAFFSLSAHTREKPRPLLTAQNRSRGRV